MKGRAMKTTYNDINLDNAVVIMRIGVLDENLNWIPADEEDLYVPKRQSRSALIASSIGALAASFIAAFTGFPGASSPLF